MSEQIEIRGFIAPGFEPVADAFRANFAAGNEIGAGFALMQDGEVRIDIHAGAADRGGARAWSGETLAPIFSTGKAVTALVMAWLVDQGRIAYDTPIAAVWPDFGVHGKDAITLEMALSHQTGFTGVAEEMDAGDWLDREVMEPRIAAQSPLWTPGDGSAYQPISFGVIADAVARRVDSDQRTIAAILHEEMTGPFGIDFHIGLPEAEHDRAATHKLPPRPAYLGEINTATEIAFLKPWSSPGRRGASAWRSAELPAANAHATAGAIAALMQLFACGGRLGEERLLTPGVVQDAMRERVSGQDRVLPFDLAYGAGVMINRKSGLLGPEPSTVGHYGFGGSCGFADPVRGVSGAYVMNRQMDVLVGDDRAMRLINAAYACL
ncbi:MAG: serine hydrolase domain-containing protein [Pseudomonadota bacterium]